MYNTELKRVEQCKYRGVIINYNTKWDKQIDNIITKTKYLLQVFAKFPKLMWTDTLLILYYALFHRIATYNIIAWREACQTNLNILQRTQTCKINIIRNKKFLNKNYLLNLTQTSKLEATFLHYKESQLKHTKKNTFTRLIHFSTKKKLNQSIIKMIM